MDILCRSNTDPVVVDPFRSAGLSQEIQSLLDKRAVEVVHSLVQRDRFYSIYFLVPKRDGGFRPILDLSRLNKFLKKLPFHMLRMTDVVQSVTEGD